MDLTEAEALARIGKKIRTRREFSGVPVGTTGTVIRPFQFGDGTFGLDIQWDLPGRGRPLVDGFSKEEYEGFLEEVPGGE